MSDKTRKVYVVWSNTDLNEGRGYEYALNVCETMATAIRRGKGQSVQGMNCRITEFESPSIDGQWLAPYYLVPPTKEDIATQARLDVEKTRRDARDAAIEKAKKLGLSDGDISALKGETP